MFHVADWREGETPKDDGATYVVTRDSRHYSYAIDSCDEVDFYEWVALTFSSDNDPIFDDYFDTKEYLTEIGVYIRKV